MTDRKLTIDQANRIADGLVTVSTNPVDPTLWQVEGDGLLEAHEPMSETLWRRMLQSYGETTSPTKFQGSLKTLLEEVSNMDIDDLDHFDMPEDLAQIERVSTFDEAGVLTDSAGLVITTDDGSEFQLTIVQSR